MTVSESCSWCHAENPMGVFSCQSCGHDAHAPRLACSCSQCLPAVYYPVDPDPYGDRTVR
jgi:hypothetical protein